MARDLALTPALVYWKIIMTPTLLTADSNLFVFQVPLFFATIQNYRGKIMPRPSFPMMPT